jgi:hypothetical protein
MDKPMTCPECGAPVPEGGTCRDNFHALLLLEAEVPGAPGGLPHFYAVASYGLQHPGSMGYTAVALAGLRQAVADALDGMPLEAIRRRTRREMDGPTRATRRPGDPGVEWYAGPWPMTVADILTAGADGYADRVANWARSVRETLNRP